MNTLIDMTAVENDLRTLVTPSNHTATFDAPAVVFSENVEFTSLEARSVLITLDRVGVMPLAKDFQGKTGPVRNVFQLMLGASPGQVSQQAIWDLYQRAHDILIQHRWYWGDVEFGTEDLNSGMVMALVAEYSDVRG